MIPHDAKSRPGIFTTVSFFRGNFRHGEEEISEFVCKKANFVTDAFVMELQT